MERFLDVCPEWTVSSPVESAEGWCELESIEVKLLFIHMWKALEEVGKNRIKLERGEERQ